MTGMSIGRPRFGTVSEAIAWHELALAQYRGARGLRDLRLLESALAQPRHAFCGQYIYAFPFGMAAAYAYHLASNHPFVDGNKRTALFCCVTFLRMNGWDLRSMDVAAADAVLELVEGRLDKTTFAERLERHCRARPTLELRDFFQAITPDAEFAHIEAFSASTPSEATATIREEEPAIPILAHYRDRFDDLTRKGDHPSAQLFMVRSSVLVALYRLAEDMGYEW